MISALSWVIAAQNTNIFSKFCPEPGELADLPLADQQFFYYFYPFLRANLEYIWEFENLFISPVGHLICLKYLPTCWTCYSFGAVEVWKLSPNPVGVLGGVGPSAWLSSLRNPIKIGSLATFTKSASHVIELVQWYASALMVKWVFSFLTLVESQWAFALVPLLLSPVITSNEKRKGLLIWKKRRNISCRHAVPAFPASEPCSCSQLDLMWFLFDIQSCSGLAEWGWVSQVMTAKWEIHTSPRSNADLDRIQGAQSDPIWATPGERSCKWLSG